MAIYFDKQTKTFYLEGKNTTYSFFINKFGYAEHLYFGSRIGRDPLFYTRGKGGRTCAATVPGEKIDGFEEGSSYHYFYFRQRAGITPFGSLWKAFASGCLAAWRQ